MKIQVKTPAKINLSLEILKKRADGFHEIQSIMQTVSLYDYLTIEVEQVSICLTGKELGDFGDDLKSLRKSSINHYKKNIQGQKLTHSYLGEIQFSNKGIKKVINSSADITKLKILPKLKEIIEKGEVSELHQPLKTRTDGIVGFRYIKASINLNGENKTVIVNIAKNTFGHLFYNLNYETKIVDALPAGTRAGSSTISKHIISANNKNLNPPQNVIELSGNSDLIPYDNNNLVYKAAELFLQKADLNGYKVKIHIEKNIPVAAGLAGGSSNAAGTLWGLNRLFDNILNASEIHNLASQMGSDINFCLEGGTQVATSRGELLSKISTPDLNIAIIKPKNLFISAKEAYTKYAALPQKPGIKGLEKMKSAICENNSNKIALLLKNHIEEAILPDYAEIKEIKDYLTQKGCKNSLMSGSGPSVFGIYEGEIDLSDAKAGWKCFKTKSINFGLLDNK
ncbi:MAG: 4-(cytidine 5'-diphospho)-2-C-methyl-D-erythritol kinase [bacterium]